MPLEDRVNPLGGDTDTVCQVASCHMGKTDVPTLRAPAWGLPNRRATRYGLFFPSGAVGSLNSPCEVKRRVLNTGPATLPRTS